MGLHSEIIKWLQTGVVPRAFRTGAPFDWREAVVIDDVLTRLRRLYNGALKDEFTGAELFAKFAPLVWDIFRGGGKVYVCCCDITELVPAEKGREQASRDAAKEKYSPLSQVTANGILLPSGVGAPRSPWLPAVRFNIQTLCSSRVQVREKMMQFLCDCFKAEQKRIPEGAAIIMDYSLDKKPMMITRDYIGPVLHHSKSPQDYLQEPEKQPCIERRFGEADHALPFWCRVFGRRSRIYVLSVDSDVLANMATYVSTSDIDLLDSEPALALFREVFTGATGGKSDEIGGVVGQFLGHHKELIWVRPDFRPPAKRAKIPFQQVDLLDLYHQLLYKEMKERFPERKQSLGEGGAVNCTLFQFLLMCALNGTDYVDKKVVTNMIGADKVIAAVMQHKSLYRLSLAGMRQKTTTVRRRIGPDMIQQMVVPTHANLFPSGDYDPRLCDEEEAFFQSNGYTGLIYQVTDADQKHGQVTLPMGFHAGPELFDSYWKYCPDVAWQLAYWLPNYNLFQPHRTTGDPVQRYARWAPLRPLQQPKRKLEEQEEEPERPQKQPKRELVHTTCGGEEERMPDVDCERCMALLGVF